MGTCIGISKDGSLVQVDYPSEPILAEAAASLFREKRIYEDCIGVLKEQYARKLFNGMESKQNLFSILLPPSPAVN